MPAAKFATLPHDVVHRLRMAVRCANERAYDLARRFDIHPTVLSAWIHGARRMRADDPRVHRLAAHLGVDLSHPPQSSRGDSPRCSGITP